MGCRLKHTLAIIPLGSIPIIPLQGLWCYHRTSGLKPTIIGNIPWIPDIHGIFYQLLQGFDSDCSICWYCSNHSIYLSFSNIQYVDVILIVRSADVVQIIQSIYLFPIFNLVILIVRSVDVVQIIRSIYLFPIFNLLMLF